MKNDFLFIFFTSILIINSTQVISQTTDVQSVTWSDSFQPGDIFTWEVTELTKGGNEVYDYNEFGVIHGSIMQIEVLVKLSEVIIQFDDFPDNLPKASDLVRVTIDDIERDFLSFHIAYFLIPTKVNLTTGVKVNVFVAALIDEEFSFFSDNKRLQNEEYIESNTTTDYSDEYHWETETGLLNSFIIKSGTLSFSMQRIIEQDKKDDKLLSFDVTYFISGLFVIILFSLKLRRRKFY